MTDQEDVMELAEGAEPGRPTADDYMAAFDPLPEFWRKPPGMVGIVRVYMRTALGREKLLSTLVHFTREWLPSERRFSGREDFMASQVARIEWVLSRLTGLESYDRVAVLSVLGDAKGYVASPPSA